MEKTTKKNKKNKLWNKSKSRLGMGSASSSSSDFRCVSCGKSHKESCSFGTTTCYGFEQEGHIACDCLNAARIA